MIWISLALNLSPAGFSLALGAWVSLHLPAWGGLGQHPGDWQLNFFHEFWKHGFLLTETRDFILRLFLAILGPWLQSLPFCMLLFVIESIDVYLIHLAPWLVTRHFFPAFCHLFSQLLSEVGVGACRSALCPVARLWRPVLDSQVHSWYSSCPSIWMSARCVGLGSWKLSLLGLILFSATDLLCVIMGMSFNLRCPQLGYLLQKGVVTLNYCQLFRNPWWEKKCILFRNIADLPGLSKPPWWC